MIPGDRYTCDTPDSEGKTPMDSKRRLARVVCADLSEIGDEELSSIARQVMEKQIKDITDALDEVIKRYGINIIVACGIGEFLAERAAKEAGAQIVLISREYGTEISKVFPAYAVAQLLNEKA